jgi:hypothetical protein
MKIAIFGDSFGDDKINWKDQWEDVGPSWVDYLRQYHIIDNFSFGGSCLYYSKKKFDAVNLDLYDKIIFLVTQSMRRYQVVKEDSQESEKNWNLNTVISRMHQYPRNQRYLQTIHDFFVYMYNESDEYFHQLIIEDIIRKRNDTLMIYYQDLLKIQRLETNYWQRKGLDYLKFRDARKCHMNEENNLIFGKLVQNSLSETTIKIDENVFVTPKKEFSHYFRP